MADKSKLYVFEKKEIALIFIFMLLVATTTFMLGVRIGKNYSFEAAGITAQDKEQIQLLSEEEEEMDERLGDGHDHSLSKEELEDQAFQTIRQRVQEQLQGTGPSIESKEREDRPVAPAPIESVQAPTTKVETHPPAERSEFSGKFTIQLGSYRSLKDAEDFARGFMARGYDPIINEVDIPGRGTWFRVSLGVFDNSTQAKEYIQRERELFQGQEYVIGRFD